MLRLALHAFDEVRLFLFTRQETCEMRLVDIELREEFVD